ncbi:unnamed protein product [Durusdinium trenchii]|uniref:Uncharacterized protein n=1 Tax=Durusdinium trenchii TaxID=1381693 RepID=A0ABP0NPQ2_9DINO
MGVTRTYLGEIVDESNEAKGFSFLALCFSVGLFVGPILGGELVFPAERAPQIFGGTIFEEYPFLLPNLTYAIFAAIAWVIGCVFLEVWVGRSAMGEAAWEEISAPNRYVIPEDESQASDASNKKGCYSLEMVSMLANMTIVTYCALSGTTAAQNQLLILLVSGDPELPPPRSYEKSAGGFEFGPRDIGFLQNIGAVGLLSSQLFLYPKLTKKFGFLKVFLFGFFMAHLSYGLFPIYGHLFLVFVPGIYRFIPLGMMQFVYTAATGMMFPTAFAFINRRFRH